MVVDEALGSFKLLFTMFVFRVPKDAATAKAPEAERIVPETMDDLFGPGVRTDGGVSQEMCMCIGFNPEFAEAAAEEI